MSAGPVVNGEQFAPGYTREAAAYEQATRATRRLAAAREQLDLLRPRAPKPRQADLLEGA